MQKQNLFRLLAVSVFITGFSALLYQVVWQRLLGLFSGSDIRSATIVTSAFLAGLGIGSLLGSLWADRLSNRAVVRAFSACNLGIALFAFGSRFLYYDLLFNQLHDLAASPVLVLVVVFISLLIPTTLMGLSLPLLSRAIVRSTEDAAGLIAWMYGVNTLGAGLGTVVSGWYLIGTYGYETTLYLGAVLSAFVGVIAWLIAGRLGVETETAQTRWVWKDIPANVWGWCGLVFASGFMAISLQIIWFRLLDVTLKSNAYTFAHLLSIVLVADALGAMIAARWVRHVQNPRRMFLYIQGLVALYSTAIIFGLLWAASNTALEKYIIENGNIITLKFEGYRLQWAVYLAVPIALIFPPSFLIGAYYPIVQKAIQTDTRVVGQRVGLIEMANIGGNTLGGIITGLVFLEFIGTSGAMRIIALLGLVMVGILVLENLQSRRLKALTFGLPLTAALIAVFVIFPSNKEIWAKLHAVQVTDATWFAEDSNGVTFIKGNHESGALYANGQYQGNLPYIDTHVLLGAVPALVHPNPKQILIIGVGSSGTPYSAGVNPLTERITAVEIIGSELDALEQLNAEGYDNLSVLDYFLNSPRYNIIVGDGRRELALSDTQFDIIEADAIRPTGSHSGLLYSKEYFETASKQLAEGGIMAQWNATWRVGLTFKEVFPYGIGIDVILIGSNQPIEFDHEAFLAKLDDPQVIEYLSATGVAIEQIRMLLDKEPHFWTPETRCENLCDQINTDLHPKDEYYLNNDMVH